MTGACRWVALLLASWLCGCATSGIVRLETGNQAALVYNPPSAAREVVVEQREFLEVVSRLVLGRNARQPDGESQPAKAKGEKRMAYEYDLKMASTLSSWQAKRLVAERLNMQLSDEGFLLTPDIAISGGDIEPGHGTEVIEECFHFTPRWIMGFRYGYDGSFEAFYSLMLRAALVLLERGGDAVMLANGEELIFQRLGGRLVFSAEKTAHVEAIIKQEVHIPYDRRSLPSPLL